MDADLAIARIAARQHRVFTFAQAIAAGLSPAAIRHRIGRGLWVALHRGVYLLAGEDPGPAQHIVAAVFTCGPAAGASCTSAGYVWGLVETHPNEPHITTPARVRRRPASIVAHRSIDADLVTYNGFRVTHPMRTIIDLAPYIGDELTEVALDAALRRRLVDPGRFAAFLALQRMTTRRGTATLRELIALRTSARPIGSEQETLLFRLLRKHGLPVPETQFPVRTRSGVRFADLAYPHAKLALEFDSWEWHGGREAFDRERARRNELEELGFHVLQITSSQVRGAPAVVASTVGTALGLVPARWKRG